MVKYEKEICEYLQLPSIPIRKWDGKSSFKNGVCIVDLGYNELGYAVCTYDSDEDKEPRITKCFSLEPFRSVVDIFVVPNYMDVDIENVDLDDESKKAAERLAEEAKEVSKEEEDESLKKMKELPEWVFDEIHNVEEAQAWLRNYNSRNRIKGKIPSNPETLKMRLLSIYSQMKKK